MAMASPAAGGEQGLGDPSGDGFGIFNAGTSQQVERDDDAGDGSENAEQRGECDDRVEDGEVPFHLFNFLHGSGFE